MTVRKAIQLGVFSPWPIRYWHALIGFRWAPDAKILAGLFVGLFYVVAYPTMILLWPICALFVMRQNRIRGLKTAKTFKITAENVDFVKHAEWIAGRAHRGQTRKDGVTPYINHPRSVVRRIRKDGLRGYSDIFDEVLAAAWLHDVLEDGPGGQGLWLAAIKSGEMPHKVVDAVQALTKREGEPYEVYLDRVKANEIAEIVKRFDIQDNLADDPSPAQIERYRKALDYLNE